MMKSVEKVREIGEKSIDWLLIEPKRLCRLIILSICSVVVFFQLWECVNKLLQPPISTYSHFDLNQTLFYPAITICREPAFKVEVMHKYNLSYKPEHTTAWEKFPFETTSLSQLFSEATFSRQEILQYFALKGIPSNVDIEETLHFSLGRCFTLKPKISTNMPSKDSGYSIMLAHDFISNDQNLIEQINPGFHIYIHEPNERFTEHGVILSGRIEYLFLLINETMELKLTAQHFTQMRGRGSSCSDEYIKSSSICNEICRWRHVEDAVSCSGPWMLNSRTPHCQNYEDVRNLIIQYRSVNEFDELSCGCIEPCDSVIYSAFVVSRRQHYSSHPGSQLYIYYTSKLVTNVEERPGYDSSQFVADMGGSLGFLLGLSVIGIITVVELILGYLFLNKLAEKYKLKKERKEKLEKSNIIMKA